MKTIHVGGLIPFNRTKTFADALGKAQDDDVIEIHKNISESVKVDKNIIIKGHNHTLTVPTGKIGLNCEKPLEIHDLTFNAQNRSNALVTNSNLILENVTTTLTGPIREFYPIIKVTGSDRQIKIQFDKCTLMMMTIFGNVIGDIRETTFNGYYGGNIMLSTREDMNRINGNLTLEHCKLRSIILGSMYMDNDNARHNDGYFKILDSEIDKYVDLDGQAEMDNVTFKPQTEEDDKKLKKEPTNGPLQHRMKSKYALALRPGSELNLKGYGVDDASDDFLGIYGDNATLNLFNIQNEEKQITHKLVDTTLSCKDTQDQNYWNLQGGTIALVRSKINSNSHYKTAQEKLNQMIGQNSVKDKIKSITNTITMNQNNQDKNFDFSYNMVFAGDPGTGKTTFAEIVAQALFEIGAIPQNKFTKATSDDLVAGYVGQSAIQTRKILDKAVGGVLFIDEAYALTVKGDGNSFNGDVLDVIIRYMEDHRSDLIVIAAGYTKEMKEFLASNVGLERRFQWIEFEDYTPEQMSEIFELMRKSYGDNFEDARLSDYLTPLFTKLTQTNLSIPDANGRVTNGGNGGLVRNVYQSIAEARNNRVIDNHISNRAITKDDLAIGFKAQINKALNRRITEND